MPKVKTQPRCAWELCNKKLIDLAFICKADGRLFCDETCCERALQEETPRARFLWRPVTENERGRCFRSRGNRPKSRSIAR